MKDASPPRPSPTDADEKRSGEDRLKRSLLRSTWLMSLFTVLSRLAGLGREMVIAHFLGTGKIADVYVIAWMLPNLFRRLVGEGAMSAAVVPVFVDHAGNKRDFAKVFSRVFALFTSFVTLLTLGFIVFASPLVEHVFARGFASDPEKLQWAVTLCRWMFPYLIFISLAAVAQAALNTHKVFGPPAFTPVLLNLSIIASALLLAPWIEVEPVWAFVVGVLAGGMLQFLFLLPYLWRLGIKIRLSFDWRHPAVKKVMLLFAPAALGAGVYQLNVMLSEMIATYLDLEGGLAALQFSTRLTEFTLGVFVIAISTAVLPTLAAQVRDGLSDEMKRTFLFALRMTLLVTLPATAGLLLIREPAIVMLFKSGLFNERSVRLTADAFFFHAMGIVFIGVGRICVPAFYSMKDTKTPVKAAVVALVVNVACCLLLLEPMQQRGIALANSLSVLAQAVALLYWANRHLELFSSGPWVGALLRISLATALMTLAGWGLDRALFPDPVAGRLDAAVRLAVLIPFCAAIFGGLLLLVKAPEAREALLVLKRRARRTGGTP